jgi:hypothetical protein
MFYFTVSGVLHPEPTVCSPLGWQQPERVSQQNHMGQLDLRLRIFQHAFNFKKPGLVFWNVEGGFIGIDLGWWSLKLCCSRRKPKKVLFNLGKRKWLMSQVQVPWVICTHYCVDHLNFGYRFWK